MNSSDDEDSFEDLDDLFGPNRDSEDSDESYMKPPRIVRNEDLDDDSGPPSGADSGTQEEWKPTAGAFGGGRGYGTYIAPENGNAGRGRPTEPATVKRPSRSPGPTTSDHQVNTQDQQGTNRNRGLREILAESWTNTRGLYKNGIRARWGIGTRNTGVSGEEDTPLDIDDEIIDGEYIEPAPDVPKTAPVRQPVNLSKLEDRINKLAGSVLPPAALVAGQSAIDKLSAYCIDKMDGEGLGRAIDTWGGPAALILAGIPIVDHISKQYSDPEKWYWKGLKYGIGTATMAYASLQAFDAWWPNKDIINTPGGKIIVAAALGGLVVGAIKDQYKVGVEQAEKLWQIPSNILQKNVYGQKWGKCATIGLNSIAYGGRALLDLITGNYVGFGANTSAGWETSKAMFNSETGRSRKMQQQQQPTNGNREVVFGDPRGGKADGSGGWRIGGLVGKFMDGDEVVGIEGGYARFFRESDEEGEKNPNEARLGLKYLTKIDREIANVPGKEIFGLLLGSGPGSFIRQLGYAGPGIEPRINRRGRGIIASVEYDLSRDDQNIGSVKIKITGKQSETNNALFTYKPTINVEWEGRRQSGTVLERVVDSVYGVHENVTGIYAVKPISKNTTAYVRRDAEQEDDLPLLNGETSPLENKPRLEKKYRIAAQILGIAGAAYAALFGLTHTLPNNSANQEANPNTTESGQLDEDLQKKLEKVEDADNAENYKPAE